MLSEASVAWDKVELRGAMAMPVTDYVKQLKESKSGDLVFSLANGHLRMAYRNRGEDFADVMTTNESKSSSSKKGVGVSATPTPPSALSAMEEGYDPVKSLYVEDLWARGFGDNDPVLSVNVSAFDGEMHFGDSPHVQHVVSSYKMQRKAGTSVRMFDRLITNQATDWSNKYPEWTPSKIREDIRKTDKRNVSVSFNSPLIEHINTKRPNRPYTEADVDKKGRVEMSKRRAERNADQIIDSMKSALSKGPVTSHGGLVFTLSPQVPQEALAAHQEYIATNGTKGELFPGFASHIPNVMRAPPRDQKLEVKFNAILLYSNGKFGLQTLDVQSQQQS